MREFAQKSTLSPKEKSVLRHIAEGFSAKQTANLLGITPGSVTSYVKQIRAFYTFVGRPAPTLVHLVHRAIEDGVIEPIHPIGGNS